jgi:hypothetical protein
MNGLKNNGIYKGLQRHPRARFTFPWYHCNPHATSYTYVTWIGSHLGNTPNLRRISPIRHLVTFSKLDLLDCITSLSICMGKGGFDAYVWVI